MANNSTSGLFFWIWTTQHRQSSLLSSAYGTCMWHVNRCHMAATQQCWARPTFCPTGHSDLCQIRLSSCKHDMNWFRSLPHVLVLENVLPLPDSAGDSLFLASVSTYLWPFVSRLHQWRAEATIDGVFPVEQVEAQNLNTCTLTCGLVWHVACDGFHILERNCCRTSRNLSGLVSCFRGWT